MNRKVLLIVFTIALGVVASACSSPSPTVTITTPPPASLEINNSASIAATTTHDKGEGVDWSCAPAGSCGTLNPTHTDSGASTTYTAPSASGTVTITASSTKKASVTATATVTVTAVATASSLSGQYAFTIAGFDAGGFFYSAAGSVTLDGAGNVTAGEEDLNDENFVAAVVGDALTGTYTVGDDGQGTMILNATAGGVADPLVGVGGMQTLAFTVVNADHAMVTEFDAANTSGGSLDLQSASAITAGFVGNFAFTAAGFGSGNPVALGGVMNSTGTAITSTTDENVGGSVTTGIPATGTVVAPDVNGRGTMVFGGLDYAYYIVTGECIRFVEIDPGIVLSQSGYGQGSAPNFTAASLNGAVVMDEPWPAGFALGGPLAIAGQFTADGVSAAAGVVDYNEAGFTDAGNPDTITASYAVATDGYGSITGAVVENNIDFTTWGLYMTDPALNLVDPNNTSGGGGALIMEMDANDIGSGFLVPQSATALSGVNNANDFAAFDINDNLSNNVGQLVAAPTSSAGTASLNVINPSTPSSTQTSGVSLSSVITADTTNAGRYTLATTVNGAATPLNLVVYVASGGLSITVDVDSTSGPPPFAQVGSGTTQGQQ